MFNINKTIKCCMCGDHDHFPNTTVMLNSGWSISPECCPGCWAKGRADDSCIREAKKIGVYTDNADSAAKHIIEETLFTKKENKRLKEELAREKATSKHLSELFFTCGDEHSVKSIGESFSEWADITLAAPVAATLVVSGNVTEGDKYKVAMDLLCQCSGVEVIGK